MGICTDGVRAMRGKHSGMVTHIQALVSLTTCEHCSVHREALATTGMPATIKDVSDTVKVKMVNFVKARPLSSCIFTALCSDQEY